MPQFILGDRFDSSCGEIAHTMIGEGPDVVLVHGTPTSSIVWDGVVARLKERYRFHLLDLPGYGQSAKFEGQEVRLRSFARVLAEWLEAKGLDNPILVGHDFGGGTVFGAHLIEKVPVTAICVSDGVVLSPWGTPFSRLVKEHEDVFAAVPEYVHDAMLRAHLATAVSRTLDPDLMQTLIDPWLGEVGQAAYYRQIGQFDYEYTDQLELLYASIEVPTMIFWGEEDQWVDIGEGQRLQALIPGAEMRTLPDAGHFTMLDAPGLFSQYLDVWLSQVTGR